MCASKHSVEDGATDGDFGLLHGKRSSPQTSSDDGFVSPDGGLDQRAFAVAVCGPPFHSAVSADCGDMLIPSVEKSIVDWFDRVGARRNDDCSSSAMMDDCIIGWLSIIGTVGSKLSDRTVNLGE